MPVPAAVAAVAALLLPLAGPVVPPSAHPGVLVGAVLLGAAVVCGAGRHGHRAAARALRQGSVTADAGVSLATLPALTWSGFALLTPALGGPGAPTGIRDPGALLTGPSLLPGIAAVLTVVALAVRVTGRSDDDGPGEDALGAAADRWCVRMVPVTALLALAVAGFRAGTGRPWDDAATAAVAVLLAGCPLVLLAAVPAAVRAADRACGTAVRLPLPAAGRPDPVGWTAPHRGPRPADRVDTVALAGPEVLTGAVPAPLVVHPARGEDTATVLRLAGSVATGIAAGSDLGPLGRALAAQAPDALPDVAEADERPGLGMSGLVAELLPAPDDGSAPPGAGIGTLERSSPTVVAHAVLLGAPAWLLEHGIGLPADLAVQRERAEAEGHAIVAAAWDGTARAVLELTRSPHDGAGPGLDALRAAGTEPVLLTPDDDGPARALAAAAGLDPTPSGRAWIRAGARPPSPGCGCVAARSRWQPIPGPTRRRWTGPIWPSSCTRGPRGRPHRTRSRRPPADRRGSSPGAAPPRWPRPSSWPAGRGRTPAPGSSRGSSWVRRRSSPRWPEHPRCRSPRCRCSGRPRSASAGSAPAGDRVSH
ncbi:hypothetical protein FRP1_21680 [Pseudonocardia sp. EC080625-04]|nr:hypothetical protein FRP1_21680 [Pseudonocardia sp. EC080625-04]